MSAPPQVSKLTREDLHGAPAWVDTLLQALNPTLQQTQAALSRGLTLGENINAAVVQAQVVGPQPQWLEIGAEGAPAFQNGWANYDAAAWETAGYRIEAGGRVWLKGWVKAGSVPATIFTLPAGFRPLLGQGGVTEGNSLVAGYRVLASGAVQAVTGNNAYLSLNGVSFQAASPCAAPLRPVGAGWPVAVNHGLNAAQGLTVLRAEDLDASTGGRTTLAVAAVPEWQNGTRPGFLSMLALAGLPPGRRVRLTLLVWGK